MREEKVLINDLKINYKIAGEGEPILILHGWGGSSDSWVEVSEILSKKFKVICPDLPGFGKSDQPKSPIGVEGYAKILLDFTQKISLEKFDLIGHSFGGAIAFLFSIKYPQKVKSLILCSPAIIRKRKYHTLYRKISYSFLWLAKKIFSLPLFRKLYPLFRKIIYKITGSYDYYLAEGIMKEIIKKAIREDGTIFLDKLEKETLILWGEKDRNLPLKDAFFLKKGSKIQNLKF
jgi:pimeloyl-ACP methyl ester carboxylesterase